eukprot:gene13064-17512_t
MRPVSNSNNVIDFSSYQYNQPSVDVVVKPNGDKLLYKGEQHLTIRTMLGVGFINFVYWTGVIVNGIMYKDVVVQGISLAGNPIWSYVGAGCTVAVFIFSRLYAHHCVYECYEIQDGTRLGFQLYTLFGYPGRKIETSSSKVSMAKSKGKIFGVFDSSQVPLRIESLGANILLDKSGKFYANNRLLEIVLKGNIPIDPLNTNISNADVENSKISKENRTAWRKQVFHKMHQKDRKS